MKKFFVLLVVCSVLIIGCSSEKKEASNDQPVKVKTSKENKEPSVSGSSTKEFTLDYTVSDFKQPLDAAPEIVGGIQYISSSVWERTEKTGDDLFEYSLGPLETDFVPATILVSFQSSVKALSVDQNKELWYDQMLLPDGRDPRTGSISYTLDVDSMNIHILSIFGAYLNPGTDKGKSTVQYRFVGAIVESPEGLVLFSLVGPDYTARMMIEAFIPMIKKIVRAS